MEKQLILSGINIHHFRGINELKINDLSLVNVLAGPNNCGKTSALEAIRILTNPSDIGQLIRLSTIRASVSKEAKKRNIVQYLLSVFQKDTESDESSASYRIKIGANIKNIDYLYEAGGTVGKITNTSGEPQTMMDLSVKISNSADKKPKYKYDKIINNADTLFTADENDLYHAMYVFSSVNYYRTTARDIKDYIIDNGKDELLDILKSFDDTIRDISIIDEEIYLHSTSSGTLPLFSYGAGMQKALCLAVEIAYCKNGIILVDEIDNAIHVSAFRDVFYWFLNACRKYHVQAFITTHSAEALDAILSIVHNHFSKEDLLRVITLRKDNVSQITRSKIRTGEEAYSDREDYELELRI